MWFHFQSAIGVFWIRPQPNCPGSFWLGLDDLPLCAYTSPEDAAEAVIRQDVGYKPWDSLVSPKCPINLSDWLPGKPGSD